MAKSEATAPETVGIGGAGEIKLDFASRAVINTFWWALFAALSLVWLQPIVGKQSRLIFWHLLFTQDIIGAWAGLGVALGALISTFALRARVLWSFERLCAFFNARLGWICLASWPFYVALAVFAAKRHPFSLDEYSVLLQSEIFAQGRFSARIAPELLDWTLPAGAQGNLIHVRHTTGELISSYWPGMALLMAPFSALGAAFLCCPTLSSLSIWVTARTARELTGNAEVAAWTAIFCLASPVIALSAASFYAMPAHLLFNTLFCYLLGLQTRRGALYAGVVGSFALILHNPLPHLLFALPWLIWVAARRRALLLPLLAGYCAFAALLLAWPTILGSYDLSPQVAAFRLQNPHLVSAGGPLAGIAATLKSMLIFPTRDFLLTRVASTSKIVSWAAPGLLALAFAGIKARWQPDLARPQSAVFGRLLAASFFLTFGFYIFVRFDQGAGWGYRYVHAVWFALPILAGVFLARLAPGQRFGALSIRRFFGFCALGSLLILIPLRAVQVARFMDGQLAQIPAPKPVAGGADNGVSLTFIDLKYGHHSGDLIHNDPFLRSPHWKFIDRGDAADEKIARRVLVAPRLQTRGKWGQIWVGSGFTARYSRPRDHQLRSRSN